MRGAPRRLSDTHVSDIIHRVVIKALSGDSIFLYRRGLLTP